MTSTVENITPEVNKMSIDWDLVEALRDGTRGMRKSGIKYLPQRPLETDREYADRLGVSTLFPAFSKTVSSMVGRVFSEPLLYAEDVPEWIKNEVIDNVDLQGRNLHAYACEWFKEALEYGLSHTLVESPKIENIQTQADQKISGIRPYLIKINPRRVIGWREENGKLRQVRIRFCRKVLDGEFGETEIQQIRVYEPGRVRTYERSNKEDWIIVDDSLISIKEIPLITLYTKRSGMLTAEPPLRELAFLNAKHWSMQSGNDALIDTASVPILSMTGVNDGDKIVIGAKHAVRLPLGADMKFVEHSGKSIDSGRAALDSLKDEMREAGARLITPIQFIKTATQAGEDAARENSDLGSMSMDLQNTLGSLLNMIAAWRGEQNGGTVKVQPNLDPALSPDTEMTTLINMHNVGVLSDATIFNEAKRRNLLPDDLTWQDEQVRISEDIPMPTLPAGAKPVAPRAPANV